jgi:hypothetical protein
MENGLGCLNEGANSKFVKQQIIQAQKDIYKDLLKQSKGHNYGLHRYIKMKLEDLNKK